MRKLKLSELNLGSAEVLTREQLKKVLGGVASGGGQTWNCDCVGGGSQSCQVTGDSENSFWFSDCCGYEGYVVYSGGAVSNCS